LLLQKFWEWVHSAVLGIDFFDLNGTIGKVVVKDVVFVSTVKASILPENVESQHFSVVVQETFKGLVWSTTFQLNFNVVLEFSLIGWSLLKVDHGSGLAEEIFWITFRSVEGLSLIRVESSSEVIAVDNSENSVIDIEINTNVKISPCVVVALIIWEWEFMSLEEGSLWDTRVLNLWLIDMASIIIKEIINLALSSSKVLVWIFNDWLNEESFKNKLL